MDPGKLWKFQVVSSFTLRPAAPWPESGILGLLVPQPTTSTIRHKFRWSKKKIGGRVAALLAILAKDFRKNVAWKRNGDLITCFKQILPRLSNLIEQQIKQLLKQ